jgi:hypothetical protein
MKVQVRLRRVTYHEVDITVEEANSIEHAVEIAKERSNEDDAKWLYDDSWIDKVLRAKEI